MASDSTWKDQDSSGQFEVPGELSSSSVAYFVFCLLHDKLVNGNMFVVRAKKTCNSPVM